MQNTTSSTSSEGARIRGGMESYFDSEGPGPRVMAADTLEGDKVVNSAGEDLGEIKDIMIDVPSGRVAYAVLSFGGLLGMAASYSPCRGARCSSIRRTTASSLTLTRI